MVLKITEIVWILHNHSTIFICLRKRKIFKFSNMEVDSNGVALSLDNINGLGKQGLTAEERVPFTIVNVVRHLHCLGRSSCLIKE